MDVALSNTALGQLAFAGLVSLGAYLLHKRKHSANTLTMSGAKSSGAVGSRLCIASCSELLNSADAPTPTFGTTGLDDRWLYAALAKRNVVFDVRMSASP
jgi:hypothetical protein